MWSIRRMAEPVHMENYNDDRLPERLKAILYALADYHKYLLQKLTLQTQDPIQLRRVEQILRDQAKTILLALQTGQTDGLQDDALAQCIETLRQNNTPYDSNVETLMKYWCRMMFEEYPFSISHNHIEKLYQNSVHMVDE
jgi:hypothetical protein